MNENPNKRRCLVKKLDFENGVVSGLRGQARGMRKMRARMTIGVNESGETSKVDEKEAATRSSPVLMRKTSSSKPTSNSSPVFKTRSNSTAVFRGKRKISFDETEGQKVGTSDSSRTSPVFKIKSFKSTDRSSTKKNTEEECDLESAAESSSQEIESLKTDKSLENSIQIEEITQESESTVQILSDESEDSENSNLEIGTILESTMIFSPILSQNQAKCSPNKSEKKFDHRNDRESSGKKIKKSGVLHKLDTILKKHASEKLLWQHKRRQCRRSSISETEKISLIEWWTVGSNCFLKCQSSDLEVKYVVVDKSFASNLEKTSSENTVLRLHPPWRQIHAGGINRVQVFLDVFFLEVSNEPGNSTDRKSEGLDVIRDTDLPKDKFLYDFLLNFSESPFWF